MELNCILKACVRVVQRKTNSCRTGVELTATSPVLATTGVAINGNRLVAVVGDYYFQTMVCNLNEFFFFGFCFSEIQLKNFVFAQTLRMVMFVDQTMRPIIPMDLLFFKELFLVVRQFVSTLLSVLF